MSQQVAEHRQRRDRAGQHRRDLPGLEPFTIAQRLPDRGAPLPPAPLGQFEEEFLLAGVVAPHARPVQARALGDPRQGDEPNAAELDGDRLGRREQVLGPLRLVLDRSGSLVHTASLTHLEMRYPDAVAAGLGETEIELLPFAEAVTAHQRMESRALNGRIVLAPN